MRLSLPRFAPLGDSEVNEEQREALAAACGDRPALNIYRTLARKPKALVRFVAWAGYVMSRRNSLLPQQREIVILRIGYLCRSGYEFTQHSRIALETGLTQVQISAIKQGASAPLWNDMERTLIRAADAVFHDQFIPNPEWDALHKHLTEEQCMDFVFTAAQYVQVCIILNTFGIPLEDGQTLDPDLAVN